MVLFLVAMSVALLAVTKRVSADDQEEKERRDAIESVMAEVRGVVADKEFDTMKLRAKDYAIDFGPKGQFGLNKNVLSPSQLELVRSFTPKLLEILRKPAAQTWVKRTVVDGYASKTGSYLYNLNLSLERSERVLCELLRDSNSGLDLTFADRKMIATKFIVGGASFNSLQGTPEESQRIEFRIEFKTRAERKEEKPIEVDDAFLTRALDPKERCPIQDR